MVDQDRFEEIMMVLRTTLGAISTDEIVEHVPYDKTTTKQYLKYLEREGIVEKGTHNFTTVWTVTEKAKRND